MTSQKDLVQNPNNQQLGLYVTKDLRSINTGASLSLTTRPIPIINSFTISSIKMSNSSASGVVSLQGHAYGSNFAPEILPLVQLEWTDSDGNTLAFNNQDVVFVYRDTLLITILDPLHVKNMLSIVKIKAVVPNTSYISVDSFGVVHNSPSQVEIVFDKPIKHPASLQLYFQHYLDGVSELKVLAFNPNAADSKLDDSVTVKIPTASDPKVVELFIDPLLESRVVFEASVFEYKLLNVVEDNFLANRTTPAPERVFNPKVYSVSPSYIKYGDTQLVIEGAELTQDIT